MNHQPESYVLEGWIVLKRKSFWVRRYAALGNGKFFYASEKSAPQSAWKSFNLKGCKIKQGRRMNGDITLSLENPSTGPFIKVAFDSRQNAERWGKALFDESKVVIQRAASANIAAPAQPSALVKTEGEGISPINSFAAVTPPGESNHQLERPKTMLRRVSRRPADYPLKFS